MYPQKWPQREKSSLRGPWASDVGGTIQHSISDVSNREISHGDGVQYGTEAVVA